MEDKILYAICLGLAGLWITDRVILHLKTRGVDLILMAKQSDEMWDAHCGPNAITEDGGFKWHNRKSTEESIAEGLKEIAKVMHAIHTDQVEFRTISKAGHNESMMSQKEIRQQLSQIASKLD